MSERSDRLCLARARSEAPGDERGVAIMGPGRLARRLSCDRDVEGGVSRSARTEAKRSPEEPGPKGHRPTHGR